MRLKWHSQSSKINMYYLKYIQDKDYWVVCYSDDPIIYKSYLFVLGDAWQAAKLAEKLNK